MRPVIVLLTFVVLSAAQSVQDPARLEVTMSGGSLSYKVINQSPYPVVGFQIFTGFTSSGFENLACVVNAEVKSDRDLSLTDVCQLPIDEKTGKPVSYSSHLVRVEFKNGLTWTPVALKNGLTWTALKQLQNEKR